MVHSQDEVRSHYENASPYMGLSLPGIAIAAALDLGYLCPPHRTFFSRASINLNINKAISLLSNPSPSPSLHRHKPLPIEHASVG
jgi:hypothetical protein